MSNIGRKLLGGLCAALGGLMLIGGIPQLISAMRMVINPNPASVQAAAGSPGGYLVGTIVGMCLAFLLLRFGVRKFRQQAD